MGATQLADNFIKAIDIIASEKINQAGFDMTIQATILSCEDESQGLYKIKYQGNKLNAFSQDKSIQYQNNISVNVLVPNGDLSKKLTIIGNTSMTALDIEPSVTDNSEKGYDKIGVNIINYTSAEFGVHSYEKEEILVLYDYTSNDNLISIDTIAAKEYLQQTNSLLFAANFKTQLPQEQKVQGDYGIRLTIDYKNENGDIKTKQYIFNFDDMVGQPFSFNIPTRQYAIYNYTFTFDKINKIEFFERGFPNQKSNTDADIFISNLELYAIEQIKEGLTSYHLSFQTPYGTYFKDDLTKEISIISTVKENGKVISNTNMNLSFYWFVRDLGITTKSEKYNSYGGQGWRCLNNLTIETLASGEVLKTWDCDSKDYNTLIINKQDVVSKENEYKCVAIYNGNTISNTITIKNLNSSYIVNIVPDGPVDFKNNTGKVNLTCVVYNDTDILDEDMTYYWGNIDLYENYYPLYETTKDNEIYNNAYQYVKNAYEQIEQGVPAENFPELQAKEALINEYNKNIERIEANHIYNLFASEIEVKEEYICSAYYKDNFIGSGSVTLTNGKGETGYSLKIVSKNQVFKYNESGVAPNNQSLGIKAEILSPIDFLLYDEQGNEIKETEKRHMDICWILPNKDTMFTFNFDSSVHIENKDDEIYVYNLLNLPFNINQVYDASKDNNTIKLKVTYQGIDYSDVINFSFIKEGEVGTNGTEFSVLMEIAQLEENNYTDRTDIPIIHIWNYDTNPYATPINFKLNNQKWLKFSFWHNGIKIFSGTDVNELGTGTSLSTENIELKDIKWEILKNSNDISFYEVTEDGLWSVSMLSQWPATPTNIAKVSFKYNEVEYVGAIPIVTIMSSSNIAINSYKFAPQKGGFINAVYSSDGKSPKYSLNKPFEVKTFYNDEDITSNGQVSYRWSVEGSPLYLKTYNGFNNNLAVYQYSIKPEDDFNGYALNNILKCEIYNSTNTIATMYFPIHLTLNRYGNSAINGWDGNSVNLNDAGDVLLAPQMGAGKKEEDNSFTGLVMGVKQTKSNNTEIGLFGYNKGSQTIFLDAQTGKAEFGVGKAKIILDPSLDEVGNSRAAISANYRVGRSGMLIDLIEPSIQWGNQKFSVDKDGILRAQEAEIEGSIRANDGAIGPWYLTDTSLYADTLVTDSSGKFQNCAMYLGAKGISVNGKQFSVDDRGNVIAWAMDIKGGSITIGGFKVDAEGNVSIAGGESGSGGLSSDNLIVKNLLVRDSAPETGKEVSNANITANVIMLNSAASGRYSNSIGFKNGALVQGSSPSDVKTILDANGNLSVTSFASTSGFKTGNIYFIDGEANLKVKSISDITGKTLISSSRELSVSLLKIGETKVIDESRNINASSISTSSLKIGNAEVVDADKNLKASSLLLDNSSKLTAIKKENNIEVTLLAAQNSVSIDINEAYTMIDYYIDKNILTSLSKIEGVWYINYPTLENDETINLTYVGKTLI